LGKREIGKSFPESRNFDKSSKTKGETKGEGIKKSLKPSLIK